jgi:hypothetical protein
MKVFASLAVLLVVIVAAGCGGDDDEGSERAATGTETAETAPGTTEQAGGSEDGGSGSGGGDSGSDDGGGSDSSGGAPSGSGGSEDDRSEVADVVLDFHGALRDGDGEQVCSMLAERTQQRIEKTIEAQPQLEGRSCAELIELFTKNYPAQLKKALGSVDVRQVKIEGDRASVQYKVGRLPANTMPLEREDGGWRVAAFAGAG